MPTSNVYMHERDVTIWHRILLVTLGLWAFAVALASAAGLFSAIPLPLIAGLVAIAIAAPVIAYWRIDGFRRFLQGRDINYLTTFHVWRIPAALAFFYYGAQGELPATFVRHAAWGDLLAGLLVLPVVLTPRRGLGKYWAFHVFGFADFVLAVGTGLYFSLISHPDMATIAAFPLALIPLFGVGVSGASHLIAFDVMRRQRDDTQPEEA